MRPSAISLFSDLPGDLAADGVEAADDHHAGRVVDDHIDAGRLFEGADVAPFAADDAALHFVAGNIDRAGRALGGVGGGVALDGGEQDVAGLLVDHFGHPLFVPQDDRCPFRAAARASSVSSSRLVASPGVRPLRLCSVCRCMSSSLPSSSLRRLASSSRSARRRWFASTILLLLAEVVVLLLERLLPLVERPLAFAQSRREPWNAAARCRPFGPIPFP